jgi:cellulose synthase/poly-beta-1,6-N-acetylglucosamine synthase-like glycosyltransferase
MAALIFWSAAGLCLYAYAGYPVLLWLWTRGRGELWSGVVGGAMTPDLSVMLPAHNEESVLARRIDNLLNLRYPQGQLQVVVGLDGCTDGSAQIAAAYAARGVIVIDRQERGGKTSLLNEMVAASSGQVLVYTDANCVYEEDALLHLVSPFQQPEIGCVIGELKYENEDDPTVGSGEGLYWRFENAIKSMESRLGSTVVANGSIYAMRRDLFKPLPGWISDDSVNPLRVLAAGHKVVFQRQAVAREKAALQLREEFNRKSRMVTRQLGSHLYMRGFLWPPRPLLAFRLASHKLLRWLVPVFIIVALIANLLLLPDPVYVMTLLLLGSGIAAGVVGGIQLSTGHRPPRLLRLAAYFWIVNLAALKGLVDFIRGRQRAVWRISASTR